MITLSEIILSVTQVVMNSVVSNSSCQESNLSGFLLVSDRIPCRKSLFMENCRNSKNPSLIYLIFYKTITSHDV